MPRAAQQQRIAEEEGTDSDSEQLRLVSFKTVTFSGKRADDYHEWSGKFLALLPTSIKIALVDPETITATELGKLRSENAKLYRQLLLSTKGLANAIVASVEEGEGRQAWMELKEKFAARTQARALELVLELMNMRYNSEMDFDLFFLRAEYLQRQLKLLGEPVGDLMLRGFVINSLPSEFDAVRSIIQVQESLNNKELKRMLRAHYDFNYNKHYQHLNGIGYINDTPSSYAARAYDTPKFGGKCGWCSKLGHKERDCKQKEAGHPFAESSFAEKREAQKKQQRGNGPPGGGRNDDEPVYKC